MKTGRSVRTGADVTVGQREEGIIGGHYQVEHATQMIRRLLDSGDIPLARKLERSVTYHDSCHLGRINNEFGAPRDILNSIGVNIVEMERNYCNSFCCGAGGGRIWTPDPMEMEKPAEIRMREAALIEGIDGFVVNCPKCMNMFEDAVKSTGNDDKLQVIEVIELVASCMNLEGEDTTDSAQPEIVPLEVEQD